MSLRIILAAIILLNQTPIENEEVQIEPTEGIHQEVEGHTKEGDKEPVTGEEEEPKVEIQVEVEEKPVEVEDKPVEVKEEPKVEIQEFNTGGMVLKPNKASDEVYRLNKFFKIKGYKVDEGYMYTTKTRDAVRTYQGKSNLIADGIAGRKTLEKINKDMQVNGIQVDKVSIKIKDSIKGDIIVINKSSNMLYHRKDGIVRGYNVATGKHKDNTPEGSFKIITKYNNPRWGGAGRHTPVKGGAPNNPLGKRWLGLSIGGGGKYGIHGNASNDSIGRYASLGCVRMYNEDVESMYETIKKGTPVFVGYEGKLKEMGIDVKK